MEDLLYAQFSDERVALMHSAPQCRANGTRRCVADNVNKGKRMKSNNLIVPVDEALLARTKNAKFSRARCDATLGARRPKIALPSLLLRQPEHDINCYAFLRSKHC